MFAQFDELRAIHQRRSCSFVSTERAEGSEDCLHRLNRSLSTGNISSTTELTIKVDENQASKEMDYFLKTIKINLVCKKDDFRNKERLIYYTLPSHLIS